MASKEREHFKGKEHSFIGERGYAIVETEDAKEKAAKKVRGRIIAAVLLFLVPYIVIVLLDLANIAYDKDCPGMQNLYIVLEDLWRI